MILTTLTLAACATGPNGVPQVVTRQLPAPPAYLEPVNDPTVNPVKGQSAVSIAYQRGQVIRTQNKIIRGAKKWYLGVKKTYSDGPTFSERYGF